jgi:hypothetical protein
MIILYCCTYNFRNYIGEVRTCDMGATLRLLTGPDLLYVDLGKYESKIISRPGDVYASLCFRYDGGN